MNKDKQPEALRLAEWIESDMCCDGDAAIVAELRRQHTRIAELEAELASAQQEIARLLAALETYESATAELQASHLAGTPFEWTLWNIAHMQARQALK